MDLGPLVARWWAPAFYAVLTIGTIGRAAQSGQSDALGAGLILSALFVMTNVSQTFFRIEEPYNQFYPACDFIAALILTLAWRDTLEPWKAALILLLLLDVFLHAAFLYRGDMSFRARYRYDLSLNIAYIGQLACVVWGTFSRA